MNKDYKLIEELLGFYFIWFPIEFIAVSSAKYLNITNYDIKNVFIMELIYFPLKLICSYLSSNNHPMFTKNAWIPSVISGGFVCLFLKSYNFNNKFKLIDYLLVIILMENTRYYLFELFKKKIKKYKLIKVSKILDYILDVCGFIINFINLFINN